MTVISNQSVHFARMTFNFGKPARSKTALQSHTTSDARHSNIFRRLEKNVPDSPRAHLFVFVSPRSTRPAARLAAVVCLSRVRRSDMCRDAKSDWRRTADGPIKAPGARVSKRHADITKKK